MHFKVEQVVGILNDGFQVVGNKRNNVKNGNAKGGSNASLSVGSELQYQPKVKATNFKTPTRLMWVRILVMITYLKVVSIMFCVPRMWLIR